MGRRSSSPSKDEKQVIKRARHRILGLFIDGIGLDRATRRLARRVDIAALVKGVSSGMTPAAARYYTLIPFEDDSRHRAFLDAVSRAGLNVVVKRLPPKGVQRQVSIDPEMSADIVSFALGHSKFSQLSLYRPEELKEQIIRPGLSLGRPAPVPAAPEEAETEAPLPQAEEAENVQKVIVIVCPSKELSYPIALAGEFGADTVTADFSFSRRDDILKSAHKWIDLSTSETIRKD